MFNYVFNVIFYVVMFFIYHMLCLEKPQLVHINAKYSITGAWRESGECSGQDHARLHQQLAGKKRSVHVRDKFLLLEQTPREHLGNNSQKHV